ncbi:MAG: hypothetical protein KGZ61_11185 [Sandarakinorhabdus sp.]|nr:hypothetical protein [Sandarakinorhabdus sp.]
MMMSPVDARAGGSLPMTLRCGRRNATADRPPDGQYRHGDCDRVQNIRTAESEAGEIGEW